MSTDPSDIRPSPELEARVRALNERTQSGPAPGLSMAARVGLPLAVALLALGWAKTFSEMWHRWFPAWDRQDPDMTLMQRLSEGDSYYTHGPIVPAVSVLIAWLIHRRVGLPIQRDGRSGAAGWTILGGSLLLQLVSAYGDVNFSSGFALIGVLTGLLLVWGGWGLLRAYWLPVVILIFMVPLPEITIAKLNFELKFLAGRAAVWITDTLFGIPTVLSGSYVYMPPQAGSSEPTVLRIENVCGGLRSLISLTFFGCLFALVCRVRGVWRVLMLALAVPVAVASNVVRITSLNLVAYRFGVEAAGEESWFHGFSGLAVFVVALVIFFVIEWLIIHGGRLIGRSWNDDKLLGYLEHVPTSAPRLLRAGSPMPLALLGATAGLSLLWASTGGNLNLGAVAARSVPPTAVIDGTNFGSQDVVLDRLTLIILQTEDYLCRRYRDGQGRMVELTIVFSPNNRKGTHPPEVCLEGGGEEVVGKDRHRVPAQGLAGLEMQELVTAAGGRYSYHLYVYKCGDRYTPSFFGQQLAILLNGVLGRNTAGALIRFSVPVRGTDPKEARALALAAATVLMPEIDRGLP